jgi:hypothetical protein
MTREELLSISGIGEKKVELYGDEIVPIIRYHNTSELSTNSYKWGVEWPEFS